VILDLRRPEAGRPASCPGKLMQACAVCVRLSALTALYAPFASDVDMDDPFGVVSQMLKWDCMHTFVRSVSCTFWPRLNLHIRYPFACPHIASSIELWSDTNKYAVGILNNRNLLVGRALQTPQHP